MTLNYFPGFTQDGILKEADKAIRFFMDEFDLNFLEVTDDVKLGNVYIVINVMHCYYI